MESSGEVQGISEVCALSIVCVLSASHLHRGNVAQ